MEVCTRAGRSLSDRHPRVTSLKDGGRELTVGWLREVQPGKKHSHEDGSAVVDVRRAVVDARGADSEEAGTALHLRPLDLAREGGNSEREGGKEAQHCVLRSLVVVTEESEGVEVKSIAGRRGERTRKTW